MTAEDITEEVFVKGWKAIRSCRGRETTFAAWLYRIAHNQVIDTLRRRSRDVGAEIADPPGDASPEREAETSLEREHVLETIRRLPEAQKQLIVLKYLNNADNEEIGRIMGKRQGAVRALQMRALANLKQMFTADGERGV